VDDIPFGADFPSHLEGILAQCAVELVLIGPGWLDAADSDGKRRLDDPDDFSLMLSSKCGILQLTAGKN
jgi:hypothetical protein